MLEALHHPIQIEIITELPGKIIPSWKEKEKKQTKKPTTKQNKKKPTKKPPVFLQNSYLHTPALLPNGRAEGRGCEMGSVLGWPPQQHHCCLAEHPAALFISTPHAKVSLYSIKAFVDQIPPPRFAFAFPAVRDGRHQMSPLHSRSAHALCGTRVCTHSCTLVGLEPRATLPLQRGNPRLARPWGILQRLV